MLLVGANVLGLAGNYLYTLICIRWLGAVRFGDVAAVMALATMISLPFTGLQAALARDVARLNSLGTAAASEACWISSFDGQSVRRRC